ncbi:hypothetical protein [Streptomyces parvus]|uniref:Uncharacterized protein n=1 Tax=Streptomyces parvus TaxID=66428 RepID=A0A7K3S125_9ACTN|nr:hypothetical protein [Streptomyces parvus]NEC21190.1 hypothetical protein [Streptomyces parvus]NEE33136.1 hypothetical protein [Streptomyces sp. SID7982]
MRNYEMFDREGKIMWGAFWTLIEMQLKELQSAKNADDVIRILGGSGPGDAHFAGSGGDGTVRASLFAAGWELVWQEADYFWVMKAPDDSMITYIEGDIYRGDKRS